MKEHKSPNFSSKDMLLKGLIIALIITIPSLTVFGISWYLLDDLIQAAIIGVIVHLIAMGFSLKISKKFLIKN